MLDQLTRDFSCALYLPQDINLCNSTASPSPTPSAVKPTPASDKFVSS